MSLIPNYLTRFRTRSQSTAASSSSTAPSLDLPTPAGVISDGPVISSLIPGSNPNCIPDADMYMTPVSPAASSTPSGSAKSRKSRPLTVDKSADHSAAFESGGAKIKAHMGDENQPNPNFISRILSSYANAPIIGRKRSFTVPLTGVSSSSSSQVPQTPISSPSSGSYHTALSGNGPSPRGRSGPGPGSAENHTGRSSPQQSHKELLNPRLLLLDKGNHKHDYDAFRQHDTASRIAARSGKDTPHQGRQPSMTETVGNNTLVTAQADPLFTPPRTSTPPPPQKSPSSYRGRQPPHTYPPRSRSRHTFDGGARPVFLSEGHSGSSILFPSFRRMSESLNKIVASPNGSSKIQKEARIDDVFTDADGSSPKSGNKTFVLSEQRRLSADWSSIEAIRGDSGGAESWPSSVSREMVRLSLKDDNHTKSAPVVGGTRGNVELGSTSSPEQKSLASDIDVNPKNPTLFGSIGEDRRLFFRANKSTGQGQGRRGHKTRSSLTQFMAIVESESAGGTGSATVATQNHDNVNVSESRLPNADRMTKGRSAPTLITSTGSHSNTIPFVSVTAPTPTMSGHRLSLGSSSDHAVGSKRKISDAEDELVSSAFLTTSTSAPPNSAANKNSVRSILLTRRESADRPSDASYTSHAPSSFRQQTKRIRLSETPPPSQTHSRPTSPPRSPPRNRGASSSPTPASRPSSSHRTGAGQAGTFHPRAQSQSSINSHNRAPSIAGSTSIPVLAILTPKAPSIDTRHSLNTYHMRDPSLPPSKRQSAVWKGAATRKVVDEDPGYVMRSRTSLVGWGVERRLFPLQGWAFIVGFVVFPLWWIAAVCPVVWGWGSRWKNRRKGYGDPNMIMTEEELQDREILEYDVAYIWRQRCRIMSFFGLFVYVPLIVLLAVLVPRNA